MATPAIALGRIVSLVVMGWLAASLQAQEVPPPAYQMAAQRAGVPTAVLYAVALQESGTRFRGRLVPWPWTLNVAGAPHRFGSHAAACAGLQQALQSVSPTRIDAGLGQINLGYQRHRYEAPCELLDPYRNLALAAEILREQHTPGGDWLLTVGRYHRPAGGAPAMRYRRSVGKHLERVVGAPRQPTPQGSPAMKFRCTATAHLMLSGALVLAAAPGVWAQPKPPRTPLVVVEDRGGVSALPYYEAVDLQPAAEERAAPAPVPPRAPDKRFSEADMLPVRSARLSPGEEPRRAIQAPGLTPIFLVGDDARSRTWLRQRAVALQAMRAVGLVVQVDSAPSLAALRALAPGLQLVPASGDDLAQRLGLRHYPVLITATAIEP